MARKKFKIKVSKSTHWYFTIIVKELFFLMFFLMMFHHGKKWSMIKRKKEKCLISPWLRDDITCCTGDQ